MLSIILLIAAFSRVIGAHDRPSAGPVEKDIVILGGGASGTYAAVRLREDYGKSVLLIEHKDHLGGHVATYDDPLTGNPVNYGVQAYMDYGGAHAFFERLNVSMGPNPRVARTSVFVDFETAQVVRDYVPPSSAAQASALDAYQQLTKKYESILVPGYWSFPAPADIPQELLMPFGQFARKYGIEAAVPFLMTVSNVGVGGIENVLTLYVMQAYGAPVVPQAFFVPQPYNNSILYDKARHLLGPDVLLSTKVSHARRGDSVTLYVIDEHGVTQEIHAKRLLVTANPRRENLAVLSLDKAEEKIFSSWTPTMNVVGLVRQSIIPDGYSVTFIPPTAAPSDYLSIRNNSYTLRFDWTGTNGLYRVLFASNTTTSDQEAKDTATRQLRQLAAAGTFNATANSTIEFVAFANHNSVKWDKTVEELRDGFVQKLYALEGRRSTWYSGELWSADYSSIVWAHVDALIPRMLEGL